MEHRKTWIHGIFCIILSLILIIYKGDTKEVNKSKKSSFFHRYHDCLVKILNNHSVINSTLLDEVQHAENITVQFVAFGRNFLLDLSLNKQLFTNNYVEKFVQSNGQRSTHSSKAENCFYHGKLRYDPHSEAAISTCHGLIGYVTDKHDTYHIEPVLGSIHRVYRQKDRKKLSFRCGTEGHDARLQSLKKVITRHKRSIQAPYDSNTNTRYVELYLVNDYRTFERHGKRTDVIIKRSQDIANIVSSLYRQLNIYVVLVGVEVWVGGDQVSVTTSADHTMENFLRYRKERINPYHHNDNAQLITGIFFEHGVVGKAIKGPICTHQFSGGVNMDYGGLVTLVATTVAHEMGHNFGMEHDNDTTCECRDEKCIMAATSGQISPKRWSSCSQNALAEAFDLGMDYCLRNLPTSIYEGPICGNGLKEDGEECDCGLVQDCANRCCNATTCRMHSSAHCASGMCCDFEECKIKEASTMCREPTGECDLGEFCDGTSENCPDDVFVQNGVQCKSGLSYCYNGQCSTHSDQCKLLWGDTGRVSDPICFQQLNTYGNNDGNCGYNWTTDKYKRCEKENVMCGLLHCVHLNEKLMFWRDNLAIDMRASFLSRGNKQYVCRSAMLDVGLDMPDPGFVPDGAKCEQDKICINQQCVPLAKLKIDQCADNCHGHGKCNSKGNCHCSPGYAPPYCDRPGFGGSVDSGPASNEYDFYHCDITKKDVLITVLVVLLLVVPLVIFAVVGYFKRKHLIKWWTQLPSLKYRVHGKPKCKTSTDSSSSIRKDFGATPHDRENLIFNPQGAHTTADNRTKVWNSSQHPPAPLPPPERPKKPPSVLKVCDTKTSAKKVKLSLPIQETNGPPSPTNKQKKPLQFTASDKLEPHISHPSSSIVKRESFRGSEISDPVLVCTTNRNSVVLADGNVDIIGPEARLVTGQAKVSAVTVKRSQSDRPVARPEAPRPVAVPPHPGGSTLKKSASARSPTKKLPPETPSSANHPPVTSSNANSKVNPTGFRPRPVPPIPTEEEEEPQPIYTNETSDMSDLLSAIEGVFKVSTTTYGNISTSGQIQKPIQETVPPAPSRSTLQPLTPKPSTSSSLLKPVGLNPSKPSDVPKTNVSTALNSKNVRDTALSKPVNKVDPETDSSLLKMPGFDSKETPKLNTDAKPKPDLISENKEKMKGAVSDELRNKIINRSGQSPITKPSIHKPLVKQSDSPNTAAGGVKKPSLPAGGASRSSINNPVNRKTTGSDKSVADIKLNLAAKAGPGTTEKPANNKVATLLAEERKKEEKKSTGTESKPKPGASRSEVTRTQSLATSRPSLPPKPETAGTQPKRVQSFRI